MSSFTRWQFCMRWESKIEGQMHCSPSAFVFGGPFVTAKHSSPSECPHRFQIFNRKYNESQHPISSNLSKQNHDWSWMFDHHLWISQEWTNWNFEFVDSSLPKSWKGSHGNTGPGVSWLIMSWNWHSLFFFHFIPIFIMIHFLPRLSQSIALHSSKVTFALDNGNRRIFLHSATRLLLGYLLRFMWVFDKFAYLICKWIWLFDAQRKFLFD